MRLEGLILALFFWANYASADIVDWFKPSTIDLKTVSTALQVDTTISQLCKYSSNVATLREKEYSYLYTVDGETVTSEILFVPVKYRKFSVSWYFKFTESPHATGFKVAANGDDIENVSGVVNLKNGEAIITYDVIFPVLSFVDSVIDYCVNEFVSWTWEVFNPATGGDEVLTFYTGNLGATQEQLLNQFTCSIVNFLDCPIYSAGLRYDCQGLANFQTCSQVATLTGPASSSEIISSVESSVQSSSEASSEASSESSVESSSETSIYSSDDTSAVQSSEVLSTSSSADVSSTVSASTSSTATDAYITGYYVNGQPHWDLHVPGSIGTWTSIEISGTNGGAAYRYVSGEFLVDGDVVEGSITLTDTSYEALYEEPIDEASELVFSLSAQATGPAPYIFDAHIIVTTPDGRRVRIMKRAVIDYDFSNTLVSDASFTTDSTTSSDTLSDSVTPTSQESSTLSSSVSSDASSVLSLDSSSTSDDVTSYDGSSVDGESTASGSAIDTSSSSTVTDGASITSDDSFTTADNVSTSISDSSEFNEGSSTAVSSDITSDISSTATGDSEDDEATTTFTDDGALTVFTDAFGNIVTGSLTTVTTTNSDGYTVTLTTTYCPATESQVYTGIVTTVIEGEVLETPLVTSYEYITIYNADGEVETIITTYVTERVTVDNPTTSIDANGITTETQNPEVVDTFVTSFAEVSGPEAEAETQTASISDVIGTGIPIAPEIPASDSEEKTTVSTTVIVPTGITPTYSESTSLSASTAAVVSSFEGAASQIQVQGFFVAILSIIVAVLF